MDDDAEENSAFDDVHDNVIGTDIKPDLQEVGLFLVHSRILFN